MKFKTTKKERSTLDALCVLETPLSRATRSALSDLDAAQARIAELERERELSPMPFKTTPEQRAGLRSAICDDGHHLLPLRSCTYETGNHSICVGPEGHAYDVCDVPKGNEAYLALIVAAVNALPGMLDDLDAAQDRIAELERAFETASRLGGETMADRNREYARVERAEAKAAELERERDEARDLLIATVPEDLVCLAETKCPSCGETMSARLGTELKFSRDTWKARAERAEQVLRDAVETCAPLRIAHESDCPIAPGVKVNRHGKSVGTSSNQDDCDCWVSRARAALAASGAEEKP